MEKGWGEDGRIAWELIAAGYEDVKIVDGGIKALKAAGVETVKGVAEPKPVSVEIDSIDETHVINTDELKETVKLWIPVQIKNTMERQCMGRQMGDIFQGQSRSVIRIYLTVTVH